MQVQFNNMASGKRKRGNNVAEEVKLSPYKKYKCEDSKPETLQNSDALTILKDFLQRCESDGHAKVVIEYFESGKTAQDMVNLIQGNKTAVFVPLLSALHFVVMTVIRDIPAHRSETEEACRYLLDNFLSEMQDMLSHKSPAKHKKVVLKLFAAMVTLNVKLGRTILVHIKFTPHMLYTLTKHTRPSETSVRTCFIHFLMSYFIDKNTLLITSLLQKKGVVTSIINGLMYDDADTVNLVLSTLYENVIINTNVSKTLKLHTFSTPIIQSLLKLYNWEGPDKLKVKNTDGQHAYEEEAKDNGERKMVKETLHNFLIALCTSHKYGVAFHDKNVGTSKTCNELLQSIVASMEKPWENELLSELTQKILASCPDLVKNVISVLEPYLEPRISSQWLKAVEFVKTIFKNTDPDVSIKPYAKGLKMQQLISVVHTFIVPASLLHSINEKMLQHEHLLVRHEGIELLSIMLYKFLNYIKALKNWKLIDDSAFRSICGEVMKKMPNPEGVLSLWKRALKCKADDESAPHQIPTLSSHLSSVVDLWLLYNQCFPSTLNITNSLELLNDIQNVSDGNDTDLQLKMLKLIMILDPSVLTPGKDVFRTALLQLSHFTDHTSQDIVFHSRNVFTELLINCGIFEGVESEVNIWAYCCFKLPHKHVNLVMQILHKALIAINKNPNLYAAAISQSEESVENNAGEDNKKLEQILEDLLETQPYVNELQSHAPKARCYYVKLSPLLPAVLKIVSYNDYRENSSVIDFLSCAIIHLIHSHPSPKVVWHLLQDNFDPLPFNVSEYIDGWLNKNMMISVEEILGKDSIEARLSRNLINSETSLCIILNLECTINETDDKEAVPVVLNKQTIFVSKASIKKADPVHLVLLYKLTVFHLTQMAAQDSLKEPSKEQFRDTLIILLTILQSFDNEQKAQYTADCLNFTFTHPILLSLFRPLHKKKANKIVEIIEGVISSVPLSTTEVYHLLIPFKQKIVHQVFEYVKKCQRKKMSEERKLPTISLYGLTSPDINVLMDHLVQVPVEILYNCKEKIQLSTLGKILAQLLNLCVSVHEPLPSYHLAGIAEHLIKMMKLKVTGLNVVVNSLYRYLDKFRHNLENIPGYLFYSLLLQEVTDSSSVNLAALLLRYKINLSEFFVSLIRKNRKFRSKSEVVFPLLSALIELSGGTMEQTFLEKVYTDYLSDIRKGILAPSEVAAWLKDYEHIAVLMIEGCMDLNTCVTLCKEMESGINMENSDDFCFEITKAVLCKANRLNPEQFKVKVILLIVMQLVHDLCKRKLSDKKLLGKIHLFVKTCAESGSDDKQWRELKSSNIWLKFVSLMLKYGIQVHKQVLDTEGYLLCTLMELCNIVYKTTELDSEVLKIYEMALSHSEFLSVILGEATKKKYYLVKLLLVLMEKNPSVMVSSHVPIILSAYHATLSETDQNLLWVLKKYEAAGVRFHNYRPYLWGEAAMNHYSVKSKARFALWRQPKPSQVLDLLDMERLQQTVKKFPITRDLDGCSSTIIDDEVYDIAFLLPLFSHLLAPEQFVQTHKFISCGGLALTLLALASQSERTRKAAYHVLSRFYFHEEASRNTKKRMLHIQFLDAIRLGIANLNNGRIPQLSSIVTTFLARASLIVSQANHPLYRQIQNFIIAKPSINLQIVPEFLTYFHSADVEYKSHRQWILEVLRDGFRSELDMKVCLRSPVFKLLNNFYFSVLADVAVKTLILEVIDSAVRVPNIASLLVTDFGLVPQLSHIIKQFPQFSDGKVVIVNVLHNLWTSLSSKKKKGQDWSESMMLLLLSVLLLKPPLTESELKTYLSTFYAVLSCSNRKFILHFLSSENMNKLLQYVTKIVGHIPECEDMLKYGGRYVDDENSFFNGLSDEKMSHCYLKKIVKEWLHKVQNYKSPIARH